MMMAWDVNYLAALVAAVAAMAIGTIYYMPAVAGRAWMKAIGKTPAQLKESNRPSLYVVSAILAFLQAIVMAAVIGWSGDVSLGGGALIGFLLWLGLAIPVISNTFIFEGRMLINHVISGGYYLISFVVMGGIIGAWG
ncbi:MAG: DUF1761 domain-containing protein [Proteobacteria bacterium]|nr:DUF1761 domain-containing protein [Pseudomonadota bacterium]MDA1059792.1 DUF1761 domain-containing protein [Pseudomonadota bacterium]